MRTIIFSDTHLTHIFDQSKFNFLTSIISTADKIIINGDFWDYYLSDWGKFITSKWTDLFKLLKSKDTIYIYGNHDKKYHSDSRVNLFSKYQTYNFELRLKNKKLEIQHGHLISPSLESTYSWLNNKPSLQLGYRLEYLGIKLFGKSFLQHTYKDINMPMKTFAKRNYQPNTILVCGHSHCAEFNVKENFINTGFIRYGFGQYLMIDGNDDIEIADTRYM